MKNADINIHEQTIRHFEQKVLNLTQINLRASNAVSALAQSTISLTC